jgi:hypothetical protein
MIKETGVDGGMAGYIYWRLFYILIDKTRYGALVKPSIFSATPVSIEQTLKDYLEIARERKNAWVDILRHVQWILKKHNLQPQEVASMFRCTSLEELWYISHNNMIL